MSFMLHYRGKLRPNGTPQDKDNLRRALHPQLEELWNISPLNNFRQRLGPAPSGDLSVLEEVNGTPFACLVSKHLNLFAELDIIFLRKQEKGSVITRGGDIDNRLKTLFDALPTDQ